MKPTSSRGRFIVRKVSKQELYRCMVCKSQSTWKSTELMIEHIWMFHSKFLFTSARTRGYTAQTSNQVQSAHDDVIQWINEHDQFDDSLGDAELESLHAAEALNSAGYGSRDYGGVLRVPTEDGRVLIGCAYGQGSGFGASDWLPDRLKSKVQVQMTKEFDQPIIVVHDSQDEIDAVNIDQPDSPQPDNLPDTSYPRPDSRVPPSMHSEEQPCARTIGWMPDRVRYKLNKLPRAGDVGTLNAKVVRGQGNSNEPSTSKIYVWKPYPTGPNLRQKPGGSDVLRDAPMLTAKKSLYKNCTAQRVNMMGNGECRQDECCEGTEANGQKCARSHLNHTHTSDPETDDEPAPKQAARSNLDHRSLSANRFGLSSQIAETGTLPKVTEVTCPQLRVQGLPGNVIETGPTIQQKTATPRSIARPY